MCRATSRRPRPPALTLAWATSVDAQAPGTTLPKTTISDRAGTSHWRVVAFPFQMSDDSDFVVIVVGQSINDVDSTVARFLLIFFGFALAVVVFGAATTQLLVTSTFSPLRDVEATAARFAAGDYSQRLGGATPNTEVGRLNRSLNTMLARIDRAFADRQRTVEQMRRFVGDASHELRTPLVSVRGYAELYRMGAITSPDDVAQAMDRIEREAIRMGALVEDLLELARLDEAKPLEARAGRPAADRPGCRARRHGVEPAATHHRRRAGAARRMPRRTPPVPERPSPPLRPRPDHADGLDLHHRHRADRLRRRHPGTAAPPPAARRTRSAPPPGIRCRSPMSARSCSPRENKIRQVITNLIGNAMRFTPPDSPIELAVEVDRDGGFGQISVIDHGEGIPPQIAREDLPALLARRHLTHPRHRRQRVWGWRSSPAIVANHHGHVEVVETPGGGATFRVSLPLFHPEPAETDSSTDAAAPAPGAPTRS